jgi:hypothetical protein
MTDTTASKRKRRMAREPKSERQDAPAAKSAPTAKLPSKLDQLGAMLDCEQGTSIAEMVESTGWQQHSVRGAMAGALKKRGLTITSQKVDGMRRYRAERTA